jgi:hypothetical protein
MVFTPDPGLVRTAMSESAFHVVNPSCSNGSRDAVAEDGVLRRIGGERRGLACLWSKRKSFWAPRLPKG